MAEVEAAALYINFKGQPVTHSSYSSRQTFKHCPRQFLLERVEGWSDKEYRAAPEFGKVIEAAVLHHDKSGRVPGAGVQRFVELWAEVQKQEHFKEWKYTDAEGSYEQLTKAGIDLLRLYEIRAPFLPISTTPAALWQQSVRKKIFPGTKYDKLENKAVLDIFSFPHWKHPLLPETKDSGQICPMCESKNPDERMPYTRSNDLARVVCTHQWHHTHITRSLIIDMKTSGEDLDTELVALDPQLAEYAWQLRVPDVAFLWFVKKSPEYQKGARVTLLQDAGEYKAGFEMLVLYKWAPMKGCAESVVLGTQAHMDEYRKASTDENGETFTGNALKAAKQAFLSTPGIVQVLPSAFTKQRLQFKAVRLTETQMNDTGRSVAQTTVEMLRAREEDYYPQLAGVRFPNQKCNFCSMKYICLGDSNKRDELLTKRGEEWLDAKYEEGV